MAPQITNGPHVPDFDLYFGKKNSSFKKQEEEQKETQKNIQEIKNETETKKGVLLD